MFTPSVNVDAFVSPECIKIFMLVLTLILMFDVNDVIKTNVFLPSLTANINASVNTDAQCE